MKKTLLMLFLAFCTMTLSFSQTGNVTNEAPKAEKKQKQRINDADKAEIDAAKAKINTIKQKYGKGEQAKGGKSNRAKGGKGNRAKAGKGKGGKHHKNKHRKHHKKKHGKHQKGGKHHGEGGRR